MGLKHKKYIGGQDGYCDKIIKLEEHVDRVESNLGGARMEINKLDSMVGKACEQSLTAYTIVQEVKEAIENIRKEASNLKWWVLGGLGATIILGISNKIFNLW